MPSPVPARLQQKFELYPSLDGALATAWEAQPAVVQAILEAEVAMAGNPGQPLLHIPDAPYLFSLAHTRGGEVGVSDALFLLARILFQVRGHLRQSGLSKAGGAVKVGLPLGLIEAMSMSSCRQYRLQVRPDDKVLHIGFATVVTPDAMSFNYQGRVGDFTAPNRQPVFIGIGGGSDAVQARLLALTMGCEDAPVISIRSATLGSPGQGGKVGEPRTVTDAIPIVQGVYRMSSETRSNGRFDDYRTAEHGPAYLVLDAEDGTLSARISSVLHGLGTKGLEIIAVDTGGDCLYPYHREAALDATEATPDQDLAALIALHRLRDHGWNIPIHTAILALGTDSPADAEDKLRKANAKCYAFSREQQDAVLRQYQAWDMGLGTTRLIGLTPLVLQTAFTAMPGGFGLYCAMPLPPERVTDPTNPWDPFIPLARAMRYVVTLPLKQHLRLIGYPV